MPRGVPKRARAQGHMHAGKGTCGAQPEAVERVVLLAQEGLVRRADRAVVEPRRVLAAREQLRQPARHRKEPAERELVRPLVRLAQVGRLAGCLRARELGAAARPRLVARLPLEPLVRVAPPLDRAEERVHRHVGRSRQPVEEPRQVDEGVIVALAHPLGVGQLRRHVAPPRERLEPARAARVYLSAPGQHQHVARPRVLLPKRVRVRVGHELALGPTVGLGALGRAVLVPRRARRPLDDGAHEEADQHLLRLAAPGAAHGDALLGVRRRAHDAHREPERVVRALAAGWRGGHVGRCLGRSRFECWRCGTQH